MKKLFFVFALLALPTFASAQNIKNPTAAEWVCPDHDVDTQHELTVLQVVGTNKVVITTLLLGDPAYLDATTKTVRSPINVQPIAFGDYVARVNAVVGTSKSDDSPESNAFTRAPGSPSKLLFK